MIPVRPLEKSIEVLWGRSVPQADGCVVWTRNLTPKGYGLINYGGKNIAVHRLAYLVTKGPIPKGVHVLHHCDNRACVNVDHLFLGTNQDNILDKCRKGRAGKKLSLAQVLEIKALLAAGMARAVIAKRFGVCQPAITKIALGYVWSKAIQQASLDAGGVLRRGG